MLTLPKLPFLATTAYAAGWVRPGVCKAAVRSGATKRCNVRAALPGDCMQAGKPASIVFNLDASQGQHKSLDLTNCTLCDQGSY